jgi:predicted nucleic acid-binding protein
LAGVVEALAGHRIVGFDTAPFIYQIEAAPQYSLLTRQIFRQLDAGIFQGVTSILTLMEIIVQPLQRGTPDIAAEYVALLTAYPYLTIVEIGRDVALRAAGLRATWRLQTPDALQLAACLSAGATAFVTNDVRLRRVSDLQIILLTEFLDQI